MTLKEQILEELAAEAAATRKTLARIPEGQGDWQPHPKSMPLGRLSSLCALMLGWIGFIINEDETDIMRPDLSQHRISMDNRAVLLEALDKAVAASQAALEPTTDEHLQKVWKMLVHGHEVSSQSRREAIRYSVFNHLAHHRGQLTVYLRLTEAPVPAIYGPSADEGGF